MAMFEKVLIANRGEIALRVIRACKELGIRTLAVYSEADVDSLHVQLADESICIGAAPSLESYLKLDRIMSAAEIGDVDAIHPGYGFLAENPHFAEVCESCNIKFIGPPSRAMQAMGDKNAARAYARKAGVPVTPGSDGIVETEEEAMKIAKKIGYPVMIKAAAGGGGRGMRTAHNEPSLKSAFHSARHEAQKAFGNDQIYLEKFIVNPHHIEFQIIAAGQPMSPHVAHAVPRLHAIECRINAEDPANDFQPTPGRIDFYYAPGGRGVRIDSHVYTGYAVPPYYDSLIAKIITVGATRINAIDRMRRALDEYYITGIKTTVPFHAAMMRNGDFRDGNYDTGLMDRLISAGKLDLASPPIRLRE